MGVISKHSFICHRNDKFFLDLDRDMAPNLQFCFNFSTSRRYFIQMLTLWRISITRWDILFGILLSVDTEVKLPDQKNLKMDNWANLMFPSLLAKVLTVYVLSRDQPSEDQQTRKLFVEILLPKFVRSKIHQLAMQSRP